METATLDDFMALNDQLAALVETGVPLELGLETTGDPAGRLERINAAVARRVSRGASLAEALAADAPPLPVTYRSMVELGLRSGNLSAALEGANRLAESVDESRHAVRSAFFYPLVVCVMAYAGIVLFSLFYVPRVARMYDQLQVEPPGLRMLLVLRDTLPYWVAIPPVALVFWIAWGIATRSQRALSVSRTAGALAWLPGMSRAMFQERCANFAAALAALVTNGVPLAEGLPLAAGASGDARLGEAARALAASLARDQLPPSDTPAARQFPPFLRWALVDSEPAVGRAHALEMAAEVYRQSAQRRLERLRVLVPVVTCVVIGGSVTLLYGLALFLPAVELIRALGG